MDLRRHVIYLAILVAACGEKSSDKSKTTRPSIRAIEPNAGRPGTKVTIHGARLIGSDKVTGTVHFGDVATAPTFATTDVAYGIVPDDVTAATHEVVVTTIDGASVPVTFAVTGPTPEELKERAWTQCMPAACAGDTAVNATGTACDAKGATILLSIAAKDLLVNAPLPYAHILVVDNVTGEPTGICALTDIAGDAVVRAPAAQDLALRISSNDGPPVNTFHQRFSANASRVYYGMEGASYDAALGYGFTPQPGTSVVFGVVFEGPHEPYFTWDGYSYMESTAWNYAGATEVAIDPESGTVVYTNAAGDWDPTKSQIHPYTGNFIIYDVAPGAFKLAYFEDDVRTPADYDDYRAFPDELTLTFPVRTP